MSPQPTPAPQQRANPSLDERQQDGLLRTLGDAWHFATPYFRSSERRMAIGLLLLALLLQLGIVGYDVLYNFWRNTFFESVQTRNADEFVRQLGYFAALGVLFVLCTTYQTYVSQALQLRWRRWLSQRLVARWLDGNAHYRLSLQPGRGDNPDQRIAEDVRSFVRLTLTLSIGLIGNAVSMASFVAILWGLSAAAPLSALGLGWDIPGYLVWMALLYALAGTVLTHLVGRPLIPLEVAQERVEADYRYGLVRVRAHAEPIALLDGARWEAQFLEGRFAAILHNTRALMRRQRNLGFFTASHRHASVVVPYLLVGPLYFAGRLGFGALMQTGSAFIQVSRTFSYFVTAYASVAELAAVVRRLRRLESDLDAVTAGPQPQPAGAEDPMLTVRGLQVRAPAGPAESAPGTGPVIAQVPALDLQAAGRLRIVGEPGAGKTSLLRTSAGLWPAWEGALANGFRRPAYVLRESYLPPGSLLEVLAYPQPPAGIAQDQAVALLQAVGLGHLVQAQRPADIGADRVAALSTGERQRLGVARALAQQPDVLWLDEAFVSLPDDEARRLLDLVAARLPTTAVVVLGHDTDAWCPPAYPTLVLRRAPAVPSALSS
jgi:putative ATP-binding cassette transporter